MTRHIAGMHWKKPNRCECELPQRLSFDQPYRDKQKKKLILPVTYVKLLYWSPKKTSWNLTVLMPDSRSLAYKWLVFREQNLQHTWATVNHSLDDRWPNRKGFRIIIIMSAAYNRGYHVRSSGKKFEKFNQKQTPKSRRLRDGSSKNC